MSMFFGISTVSASALRKSLAVALLAGFAIVAFPATPVLAQDSNLAREIERLRREIADLQRYVYKGKPPAGSEAAAADTEVAARLQLQIGQLQDQLRQMNGQIEELKHRADMLDQRLERMSQDLEIRLREIEDRLGAAPDAAAASDGGEQPPPDTGEGGAGGSGGAAVPDLPADATAQQQYDHAFELLKVRDFDAAATALQAFLDKNPKDPLAGNALYWLGETRYVQKNYKEAARIFLDGYKRFPDGSKAPDNLLKLGMALTALNEPESACKTYAKLLASFPKAPARVLRAAESEKKKLKCS